MSFEANEKYNSLWFKERAIQNITKLADNVWDFSDSLLFYLPGSDQIYESVQEEGGAYFDLVTKPERDFLEYAAPQIIEQLVDGFTYIDLGPGTEHKEQYIFDAAKQAGKTFKYIPVDISERYLRMATTYAQRQSIETQALRTSFEELPHTLDGTNGRRFVSLGLTYSNYYPQFILSLLKQIARGDGKIFVNTQIKERVDATRLQAVYEDTVIPMIQPKLNLLGIDYKKDIASTEVTSEVKIWCTLENTNELLDKKGLAVGDRLLVFQSLRPELAEFKADIHSVFQSAKFIDCGNSFLGAVLN